jgi:glucose-fructose oxidoreductase
MIAAGARWQIVGDQLADPLVGLRITAKRLVDEKTIGDVLNVHHYGGNRGPLYHRADKVEVTPTAKEKAQSWFYKKAQGGGSLLDYAGYGATIGTWFQGGRKPLEVTCMVDEPADLEVDEHSVTVCATRSLSKIETRWEHPPRPGRIRSQNAVCHLRHARNDQCL